MADDQIFVPLDERFATAMLHARLSHYMAKLAVLEGRWENENWHIITGHLAKQIVAQFYAGNIRLYQRHLEQGHYRATGHGK